MGYIYIYIILYIYIVQCVIEQCRLKCPIVFTLIHVNGGN